MIYSNCECISFNTRRFVTNGNLMPRQNTKWQWRRCLCIFRFVLGNFLLRNQTGQPAHRCFHYSKKWKKNLSLRSLHVSPFSLVILHCRSFISQDIKQINRVIFYYLIGINECPLIIKKNEFRLSMRMQHNRIGWSYRLSSLSMCLRRDNKEQ